MAMLVIRTQYMENYGTAKEPYWKMKGGQDYKILNVPLNTNYEEIVALADLEYKNEYQEEYILDWSIESDDYLSWFEKSQLEYDGKIVYKEPTIEYNELIGERTVA
jgi:hypothetical protein